MQTRIVNIVMPSRFLHKNQAQEKFYCSADIRTLLRLRISKNRMTVRMISRKERGLFRFIPYKQQLMTMPSLFVFNPFGIINIKKDLKY